MKKTLVAGKLQKRYDARVAEVQKRKEEREEATAEHENVDYFSENFSKAVDDMKKQLESTSEVPKKDLQHHFDALSVSLQKLQKFVTESTIFLPAYDIQKCQEVVNSFQTEVQAKKEEAIPKKKFAFKGKKKTVDQTDSVKKERVEPKAIAPTLKIVECNFSDRSDEQLTKDDSEINNTDVALARLTGCTVTLKGSPSAVHVNTLRKCKVFCGPVSGSIFIDDCVDCVFVLACQQLRIHNTTASNFYIHVTSKAIIEDCNSVGFGPYNWKYESLDEHYTVSGLDKSRNNWDDVDDFNWLASDTSSPNWSVIKEDDRVKCWDV